MKFKIQGEAKFTFFCLSSVQLIDLKKVCVMMSLASSGPPPSRLVGSFTSKPLRRSIASGEMFLGNFT